MLWDFQNQYVFVELTGIAQVYSEILVAMHGFRLLRRRSGSGLANLRKQIRSM